MVKSDLDDEHVLDIYNEASAVQSWSHHLLTGQAKNNSLAELLFMLGHRMRNNGSMQQHPRHGNYEIYNN